MICLERKEIGGGVGTGECMLMHLSTDKCVRFLLVEFTLTDG